MSETMVVDKAERETYKQYMTRLAVLLQGMADDNERVKSFDVDIRTMRATIVYTAKGLSGREWGNRS
jgi:hypothetical protein